MRGLACGCLFFFGMVVKPPVFFDNVQGDGQPPLAITCKRRRACTLWSEKSLVRRDE